MTLTVKRHPERERRIYYRGEGNGKKIKAISYQLSAVSYKLLAVSCKLKALNDSGRQGVILSGSEGSIPVMRGWSGVILNEREGSITVMGKSRKTSSA